MAVCGGRAVGDDGDYDYGDDGVREVIEVPPKKSRRHKNCLRFAIEYQKLFQNEVPNR